MIRDNLINCLIHLQHKMKQSSYQMMGLYKILKKDDNIYKCKLDNIKNSITHINEHTIMVSQIDWKREINYQIPFNVEKIIIEKTRYII